MIDQARIKMRKTVMHLAWPIIVQFVLMSAMNVVDTVMLGWYSNTALASVGIAIPVFLGVLFVLMAIPIGTMAMVARAVGEGDKDKASSYACNALWVGLVLGSLVSIFGSGLAQPLMAFFTTEPELLTNAQTYLGIIFMVFVFNYLAMLSRHIFRASGDTKTPMIIASLIIGLNIIGNYTLIFGKFGFMRMGVKGAAIATALCGIIEAVIILVMLLSRHSKVPIYMKDFLRPRLSVLKTLFRISLPAALEPIVFHSGMILFTKMVASLGEIPLATHRILVTIEQLSFMPGLGFSIACSTIVGQSLGAKDIDKAKLGYSESTRLALTTMTIFGIFFLLIPRPLISIFTNDIEIIRLGGWCLMITALAQPMMAFAFIPQGTLRGAGDTKSPVLVAFIGTWLVRIPLTYLLAYTAGLGLYGVWITTTLDWLVRAIVYRILYLKGRWQRIKI